MVMIWGEYFCRGTVDRSNYTIKIELLDGAILPRIEPLRRILKNEA